MKLLLSILVLLPALSFSQRYDSIQLTLEGIYFESLQLRSKVMPTISAHGPDSEEMASLNRKILAFDSGSLIVVKKIVDGYGWLGKKSVGEQANAAIFLTFQHSLNPADRIEYYPLLEFSAKKGESSLADMATMYDRIQVESGEAQLYGTQSHLVSGKLELYPIHDVENVNRRRKKMGMKKLKDL